MSLKIILTLHKQRPKEVGRNLSKPCMGLGFVRAVQLHEAVIAGAVHEKPKDEEDRLT